MSKILGVLGGMGPAATVDFLSKLQAATPAARDQDHIRVLVDLNPQVPDRNTEPQAAEAELTRMALSLRQAGAQVLAMPCNTAHAHAEAIKAASGLPFVDMIDAACRAAKAGGATDVGVLATLEGRRLYGDRLLAMGLKRFDVSPAKQDDFMNALSRIKGGDLGPGPQETMRLLADYLVECGCDAIIAGCTEVPLVLKTARVPLIDATQTLAEACIAACITR